MLSTKAAGRKRPYAVPRTGGGSVGPLSWPVRQALTATTLVRRSQVIGTGFRLLLQPTARCERVFSRRPVSCTTTPIPHGDSAYRWPASGPGRIVQDPGPAFTNGLLIDEGGSDLRPGARGIEPLAYCLVDGGMVEELSGAALRSGARARGERDVSARGTAVAPAGWTRRSPTNRSSGLRRPSWPGADR